MFHLYFQKSQNLFLGISRFDIYHNPLKGFFQQLPDSRSRGNFQFFDNISPVDDEIFHRELSFFLLKFFQNILNVIYIRKIATVL